MQNTETSESFWRFPATFLCWLNRETPPGLFHAAGRVFPRGSTRPELRGRLQRHRSRPLLWMWRALWLRSVTERGQRLWTQLPHLAANLSSFGGVKDAFGGLERDGVPSLSSACQAARDSAGPWFMWPCLIPRWPTGQKCLNHDLSAAEVVKDHHRPPTRLLPRNSKFGRLCRWKSSCRSAHVTHHLSSSGSN